MQTVWLVYGTNADAPDAEPTWFYVFKDMHKAHKFIMQAKAITPTVVWCDGALPCEVDTVPSALNAFKQAPAKATPVKRVRAVASTGQGK